ncbi:MAG: hypothetical protein R3B95_06735 [Nitrospirales bacterium]|nr:hypothetical protein [Nitrospirales bacterium]
MPKYHHGLFLMERAREAEGTILNFLIRESRVLRLSPRGQPRHVVHSTSPLPSFPGLWDVKAFGFLESLNLLFHGMLAGKLRKVEVVGEERPFLA